MTNIENIKRVLIILENIEIDKEHLKEALPKAKKELEELIEKY